MKLQTVDASSERYPHGRPPIPPWSCLSVYKKEIFKKTMSNQNKKKTQLISRESESVLVSDFGVLTEKNTSSRMFLFSIARRQEINARKVKKKS